MKVINKILCSLSKRKNTFFGTGFSVQKSYTCNWLIDWSNSVDKKMSFKLFEHDQILYFKNSYKKYNPEFFLDIGAHGGLYSIILKKYFPNLKVFSFEPDKQNRYQLYGNLFLNKLEKEINVFDFGLSNSSKEVSFGIRKKGNRGGKTIQKSGKEKIFVKPLDQVLLEKNKICFIKIDVEGHEKEVIEGSKNFLKKNQCLIQVEVLNKETFKSFNTFMNGLGYNLIHEIEDHYYTNIK